MIRDSSEKKTRHLARIAKRRAAARRASRELARIVAEQKHANEMVRPAILELLKDDYRSPEYIAIRLGVELWFVRSVLRRLVAEGKVAATVPNVSLGADGDVCHADDDDLAGTLLERHGDLLNDWEKGFLANISETGARTPKQLAKLKMIRRKCKM